MIVLPIDPRYLAVMGSGDGWVEADEDLVEEVNEGQVNAARRFVDFQPGSTTRSFTCPNRPG